MKYSTHHINSFTSMKQILIVAIFFLASFGFLDKAHGQCNHPDDYTALRALYLSTDGDNWTDKTGWPTRAQFLANPTPPAGTNMSGWYGIDRTIIQGECRINRITIVNNNLDGVLPNLEMSELIRINLGQNNLNATIPNLNLPKLEELWLNENQLSGSIPNFNLPNLLYLNLSSNYLSDIIPNFNLPNLLSLWISENQLSGSLPNLDLTNLRHLNLSYNNLNGAIPNFNLPNLQELWLNENQLIGSIPNFNLPSLRELIISNNNLTGSIPDFNSLIDSCYIQLNWNKLSGCYPIELQKFCDSKINSWGNPFLPWQGDFSQFCATDGSQQAQIGAPCNNGNPVDGDNDVIQDDCSCGLLPPCTHPDFDALMELYDSTNGPEWTNKTGWEAGKAGNSCDPCNYNGLPWFGLQCSNGRVVCIDLDGVPDCEDRAMDNGNNLTGILLESLNNITELKILNLCCNSLSGNVPNLQISSLERIHIGKNNLTGSVPNFNLPKLKYLYLPLNKLSGKLPSMQVPELEYLWLNDNFLNEQILNFDLKNLISLNLSRNMFEGEIPDFNLPSLISLKLSNNKLTGDIPLLDSTNLQFLELDINKLSGRIPEFKLKNLHTLYFSYNNLSGCIPTNYLSYCDSIIVEDINNQGQFVKVKPSIFLNNNQLLPWQGDFAQFCATDGSQQAQIGAPCNNAISIDGENDVIQDDCRCGTYDCQIQDTLIVLPGTELSEFLPKPFSFQVVFDPPTAGFYDPTCECVKVSDTFTGYANVYTNQSSGLQCFAITTNITCSELNVLAAPTCDMVTDTFCDLTLLDIGCALMPAPPVGGPSQSPLCNGGVAHNMSWFAFVAGTGNYEIEITPFECTIVDGQQGLQMGIYEDCTFTTSVECINTCFTGATSFSNANLIPGNLYYFWINGCSGSVCSYEINIKGNFQQFTIPDVPRVDITSHVPGEVVCPNSMITLEVPGFANVSGRFKWKIIDPLGNVSVIETTTNTLNFTATFEGDYIIEIIEVRNTCDLSTVTQSITIPVANPTNEDFGLVVLCPEDVATYGGPTMDALGNIDPNGDGTLGWQDPNFSFMVGNNNTTIMSMGCVFDQEVDIQTFTVSPPEVVELTLCESGFPVVVGGVTYNDATVYDINNDIMIADTIKIDDANGCDSTIAVKIFDLRMSLILGFFEDGCVNGGYQLRFEYLGPQNYAGLDVMIRWKDDQANYIDDGNPDGLLFTQIVPSSGVYYIEFMYTLNGVTCTYEYPYNLNISNQVPATPLPTPVWVTNLCATTTPQIYSVTSPDGNTDFQWIYPAGVSVTGETTNTLTVNWGNVLGGEICVFTSNVCGESEPYCQTIVIAPIPVADFDIDPVICIDSTGSITYNLPRLSDYSYNWILDSGSIIATNNSNGIDSLEVMWSIPGWKYVDLIVSQNGCSSTVHRDSIEVIERLTPPSVMCSTTDAEIVFTWDEIPNQTNVSVISSTMGVLNGNTYTVTGILPGDNVDITVTLSSTHPCGDIVISGSCITQDCTPEIISWRPLPPICLTSNPSLVVVKDSAVTATSNGGYRFSGPGIVDMVNGIFDPAVAGVGSHIIRFDYTDILGCISASSFTTINVFAVPTSDFTADNVICQDSVTRIQYIGSIVSGGTYTWDFGPDVKLPIPTGLGPFNVGWTSSGVKNVTLTTSRNGCVSSPTTIPIAVEPRIEPIVITCPTVGSTLLTFDWNDVANTSGYNLTLNNVPLTQTNNSILTLMDLGTNESFTLTVEAISNNACPGVISTFVCSTTDCPPISIMFNYPDTILCFDTNLPLIDIDATIIGGMQSDNQVITWAGPGVNPTTGIFDPNVAGVGSHVIGFSLLNGICPKDTSMIITIIDSEEVILNNDTLYLDAGVTSGINIFENDNVPPDPVDFILNSEDDSDVTIVSFDSLGNITVQTDRELTGEVAIGYTVCDRCDICTDGKIILINNKLKDIILTTLFTPKENTNNTLQFSEDPIPGSELWIYNRWGQEIFHKKDYENDWNADGYPGGVYFYVFDVYGIKIKKTLTVVK